MSVETDLVPCTDHPLAPHGFDRNGSHCADRYVCDCEGWEPPTWDEFVEELVRGECRRLDISYDELVSWFEKAL